MFANQSRKLTELAQKPTAGAADAKHAPAASVDQLPAVAPLTREDFKLNVQLPLYRIRLPRFNLTAFLARSAYASQSDAKKALPLSRFWRRPDTLQENCVQAIAGQLLQDNKQEVHEDIPDELKDLIDQRLIEAGKIIDREEYQATLDRIIKHTEEHISQVPSLLSLKNNIFRPFG